MLGIMEKNLKRPGALKSQKVSKQELFDMGLKIDSEDGHLLDRYSWRVYRRANEPKGYIRRNQGMGLHRLIMGAPKGLVVDHINGDTFDNRKCNLRIVTVAVNCQNRVKLDIRNQSGCRGVRKDRESWRAEATYYGKRYNLGSFKTKEEAEKIVKNFWEERLPSGN